MIIENIKYELENHKSKSDIIKIWFIKEYLQTIILSQIYELDYAKDLIFYWWTSLRFLFWLNRLSEDLDFIGKDFNEFEKLWFDIEKFFKKNGIQLNYKIQKFRVIFNFKDFLQNFWIKYSNSNDLYLKIEISDNFDFCEKFETKLYPIFKYNKALVIRSLSKETLFSTKINAVLYRNWEKQIWENKISVKWRDIYDLFWYLSTHTKINIDCIDGIRDIFVLKEKLSSIIEKIDFKEIKYDIENFIEDINIIYFVENNGKDYILEKIKEL